MMDRRKMCTRIQIFASTQNSAAVLSINFDKMPSLLAVSVINNRVNNRRLCLALAVSNGRSTKALLRCEDVSSFRHFAPLIYRRLCAQTRKDDREPAAAFVRAHTERSRTRGVLCAQKFRNMPTAELKDGSRGGGDRRRAFICARSLSFFCLFGFLLVSVLMLVECD